jgi:hypothetical protein
MVGNKNVVADMTNLHSKTEFSSVDEDSGRLTTTGKTPAVPSVHPAERAAVAAQIYGLVVKIWPAHCHFYASADYYGSHNAVIEQAKITDGFEIFLCRPSDDENGFRLERWWETGKSLLRRNIGRDNSRGPSLETGRGQTIPLYSLSF